MDDYELNHCITEPKGPFFTNPSISKLLFSSPSLSPPLLSPIPHLTPQRFLTLSDIPPSSISIPTSNPIDDSSSRAFSHNRLQFLPCKNNTVLVLFPTGSNLDQIGFLLLSSDLHVMGFDKGEVFVAKERFFTRIVKILVQPGYVMAYSMYSVHWYCVKYGDDDVARPGLCYIGAKRFKSCEVVSACWSPHLSGECFVLLENGEVFSFDLSVGCCRGCKMKVSWDDGVREGRWLGVEFGWRLGSFVVCRSDAVFVVTRSVGECSVRCLVEVEGLSLGGREEFVGFAKAGSDGFRFLVCSSSYVFLCDERCGVPLLKWEHWVEKPCFMDVYSLSDLGVDESDSSCVIIGSFWNAQSQMFCYGPSPSSSSLCVWELPHNVLVPTGKCVCGDCLLKEVKMKESLPEWIDWRKKKVLVLGFGVLNKYLSRDQSSGFTLIRLTSSGKLEAVKFVASESLQVVSHIDSACDPDEVNLLYLPDDEEYKLTKRFKYLELGYISALVNGVLPDFLDSKMKTEPSQKENKSFSLSFHETLCEKLKICGFGSNRTSSAVTAVFDNINSPTNVYDVALRETWSSLPTELLLFAFSNYTEFDDVLLDNKKPSLEFLIVPDSPELPPFFQRKPSSRSSKWSKKEQKPVVELVGPTVPLPVLLTLHEFYNGCPNSQLEFSPEAELSNRYNQISKVTRDVANSGAPDETIISFADDQDDEIWLNSESQKQKKAFIAYPPITKTARQTFVSRVRRNDDIGGVRTGFDLFDDMSPVEICFDNRTADFEQASFPLKTILSQWQERSSSYQEFLSQYHLHRYAIGRLYEQDSREEEPKESIAGLEPMYFITSATPHLGSGGHKQVPLFSRSYTMERLATRMSWCLGKTGKNIFLADGKTPLIRRIVSDCRDLKFISALRCFKRRIAYANTSFDPILSFLVAIIIVAITIHFKP